MDTYIIATGHSRKDKVWRNRGVTWPELVKRLETVTRTSETQGEYTNMPKSRQDDIKDVGGFVGGKLINGCRKAGSVDRRYILTLDADYATAGFCELLELFLDCAWCVYSTHKHTPEKPRLRLVIPLSRPALPDEYEAVGRRVAANIGIDMFDDTTYQAQRLMYWPSASIDGEYIFKANGGVPLDVDEALKTYADWRDITSWPVSTRKAKLTERNLKKQEDPTAKAGIIGAFCRSYTIYEAMDRFLEGVYRACGGENRYTYTGGSTTAGAVVYDDGRFIYSNHSTDPISGLLCNSFDMVRIHLYSGLDDEAKAGTPAAKMPSYLAMRELAAKDEGVKLTIFKERQAAALEEFSEYIEDGDAAQEGGDDWALELESGKNGYLSTIDNSLLILSNDRRLKNKIAYNEFTRKPIITGAVPWSGGKAIRDWTDADDAGLRHYLEKLYDIKGKSSVADAWLLTLQRNKTHPVREYLNGLVWDGEPRLDTLLTDYLGAEDNAYTRAVTRKTLAAAVARVFAPGIKFDTMLVLVGPQGGGKSQIVARLGREWYSDTLTTVQGKDAFEQIQGFWIIELAELAAMKKVDAEAIKHFTSKSEDSYRAAYGRHVESYKRQCIFIGTTNKYEFLKDVTGNRRFWPVDVNPSRAVKDLWAELDEYTVGQIWAEARERLKNGEKIYIDDPELRTLAENEQKRHLEESPLAGSIRMYLDKLLPDDWDNVDLFARRSYYMGDGLVDELEGQHARTKVCAAEIWCELFGGDKRDLTRQKAAEINGVLMNMPDWVAGKTPMRFGPLYGKQRGFIHRDSPDVRLQSKNSL